MFRYICTIIRGFTKPDLTLCLITNLWYVCVFKFLFTVVFIIAIGAVVGNSYF